ncbi:unnamed protein product [Thelazia callipaeda]|uniref:RAD51_interact domain-containing protein n=1 Tax=Thelazia callipaeda TaxID=103827 RepID=A0A0N5D663_THECL|nr:unnamed protein product [Thelazia callipaeda]
MNSAAESGLRSRNIGKRNSRRNRVHYHHEPKYSLPIHITQKSCAKEKFFPPPILHTKIHQLDANSLNVSGVLEKEEKSKSPSLLKDLANKKLSSTKIPVLFANQKCSPALVCLRGKVSSVSSASSGVGSVSEDDYEIDMEKSETSEQQSAKKVNSEEVSIRKEPAEHFEKRKTKSLDCSVECESYTNTGPFETVFEVEEGANNCALDQSEEVSHCAREPSLQRKKKHKFSLVRSFQKMRDRALSLPAISVAKLSRSKCV